MSSLLASRLLTPELCPAYILAGGQSTRFGSDKALVTTTAGPLLSYLHQTLAERGHAVYVVADRVDRYRQLGIECLVDQVASKGPLAGMATALQHRLDQETGWLLVLSCDQYFWNHAWFCCLADYVTEQVEAIAFRRIPRMRHAVQLAEAVEPVRDLAAPSRLEPLGNSETQRDLEPLPILLHTDVFGRVQRSVAQDDRSLHSLLALCRVAGILALDGPKVWSFNTPQEIAAIQTRAARRTSNS